MQSSLFLGAFCIRKDRRHAVIQRENSPALNNHKTPKKLRVYWEFEHFGRKRGVLIGKKRRILINSGEKIIVSLRFDNGWKREWESSWLSAQSETAVPTTITIKTTNTPFNCKLLITPETAKRPYSTQTQHDENGRFTQQGRGSQR